MDQVVAVRAVVQAPDGGQGPVLGARDGPQPAEAVPGRGAAEAHGACVSRVTVGISSRRGGLRCWTSARRPAVVRVGEREAAVVDGRRGDALGVAVAQDGQPTENP